MLPGRLPIGTGTVPDDPREILAGLFEILLMIVVIVGAATGHSLIVAVGGLTFVATITARAWSRLSLQDVSIKATPSSSRLFIGDETEIVFEIENRKPLPVPWLRITEFLPMGVEQLDGDSRFQAQLAGSEVTIVTGLGRYERLKVRRRFRALRRGHYMIGPAEMESGDLFGLYRSNSGGSPSPWSITVYPRTVPLENFPMPAARPVGDVRSRQPLAEDITRPATVREYVPGDPVRHIDWKTTARRGTPHVRLFDSAVSRTVVVMLEAETSASPWEGYREDVLEAAISAAASIALHAGVAGDRVGLLTNGSVVGTGLPYVRPGRSSTHLPAIMEALAMVRPVTVTPIERAMARHIGNTLPGGATVILAAGLLKPGAAEMIGNLIAKGHPVVVAWTGREAPPAISGADVRDMRAVFGVEPPGPHARFRRPSNAGGAVSVDAT